MTRTITLVAFIFISFLLVIPHVSQAQYAFCYERHVITDLGEEVEKIYIPGCAQDLDNSGYLQDGEFHAYYEYTISQNGEGSKWSAPLSGTIKNEMIHVNTFRKASVSIELVQENGYLTWNQGAESRRFELIDCYQDFKQFIKDNSDSLKEKNKKNGAQIYTR